MRFLPEDFNNFVPAIQQKMLLVPIISFDKRVRKRHRLDQLLLGVNNCFVIYNQQKTKDRASTNCPWRYSSCTICLDGARLSTTLICAQSSQRSNSLPLAAAGTSCVTSSRMHLRTPTPPLLCQPSPHLPSFFSPDLGTAWECADHAPVKVGT